MEGRIVSTDLGLASQGGAVVRLRPEEPKCDRKEGGLRLFYQAGEFLCCGRYSPNWRERFLSRYIALSAFSITC